MTLQGFGPMLHPYHTVSRRAQELASPCALILNVLANFGVPSVSLSPSIILSLSPSPILSLSLSPSQSPILSLSPSPNLSLSQTPKRYLRNQRSDPNNFGFIGIPMIDLMGGGTAIYINA